MGYSWFSINSVLLYWNIDTFCLKVDFISYYSIFIFNLLKFELEYFEVDFISFIFFLYFKNLTQYEGWTILLL